MDAGGGSPQKDLNMCYSFSYLYNILKCEQLSKKNENILIWSLKYNIFYFSKYLIEILPIQYIKEYRDLVIKHCQGKSKYGLEVEEAFYTLSMKKILLEKIDQRILEYSNQIGDILNIPLEVVSNQFLKYM